MDNTSPDVPEDKAVGKVEPFKLIDRSPLRVNFSSKAELESTDKARLQEYNMYWHLKEFCSLDIDEEIDLTKKYEQKKKIEAM